MKHTVIDMIVVGGGAAGLMAAITAARQGCSVLILEHNEELGKKILATGNGRCNFTNEFQELSCYRGEDPSFAAPALSAFDAKAAVRFFEDLGVLAAERNGYYYPRTMQASAIRNALLFQVRALNVAVRTNVGIRKIRKEADIFVFETKEGLFYSRICVLASGGKADPRSGSDGSGYIYAKQLGHSLVEPVPALVPLLTEAPWMKTVKGVRQEAKVTLFLDGEAVAEDLGEIQFTEYGISGIPVFQISRFAAKALVFEREVQAELDLVPALTTEVLAEKIQAVIQQLSPAGTMELLLGGLVNQKLAEVVCGWLPYAGQSFGALSEKQVCALARKAAERLKRIQMRVIGTKPFVQAQVTAGGIPAKEVCAKTMESRLCKNLYFAGEILDIDGMCGGYNLQWAWASGHLAGLTGARQAATHKQKKR